MIGSRVRTHLNQDHPSIVFKQQDGYLLLLKVPDIEDRSQLNKYSESILDSLRKAEFTNASEFDASVSDAFGTANLPVSFSIVCLVRNDDTAYIKTYGDGVVFLRRLGKEVPLVRNGAFAGGKIELEDEMGLGLEGQNPFENNKNSVVITYIPEKVTTENEIKINQSNEINKEGEHPRKRSEQLLISSNFAQLLRSILNKIQGKTALIFGIVLITGIILVVNLVKSYTSKTAQEDRALLQKTQEIITQKLEQAEDIMELNTGRAVALLSESKRDIKELRTNLHGSYDQELKSLESSIKKTEQNILQKNVKGADEFIDLGLEQKGAQGTQMWRYEDKVVILNPKGSVYILSLEKKSLEARTPSGLSGISLAGLDESKVYVYKKGTGIIEVESEGSKPTTVIKQDKEWGNISDLQVYNKNVYLLDSAKGQIYKYIPTNNGFASSSAYFKSGAYAKNAVSFAIDQSVFVAQRQLITKYTSGLQDGFAPQYPDKEPVIERIVTGPDVEDVYIWDKSQGSIIVLSKNGDYRKTIESHILTKATSIEVFEDAVYALQGAKIFKVSLK